VAISVGAAAAIAAGCGNGAQNDYVDQVNNIQQQIVDEATSATASTPSNPQEAADAGRQIADAFQNGADDLAALDPPSEVADLNDQLQQELSSVADQINHAADSFESGNAQQAAQAAVELQSSVTEAQSQLNSLIDQINAQFGN
jgi:uncharacterized phage infection (PIP) family protein YhgE